MHSKKGVEIVTIAGTRPEIIKLADLVPLLNNSHCHAFLYTGQHYADNMKDIFFNELKINPDYDLKCNTSNINLLKKNILETLGILKPDLVVVYGDTNSTMAGVLAAKELKCKLLHLEAGVRDFDLSVPEEINRLRIDAISDYLFCPSEFCRTILTYEDITGSVYLTGNLIVDVCKRLAETGSSLGQSEYETEGEYLLLTIHRPENSDDPTKLEMLRKQMTNVKHKIIFPVHPRTKHNLIKYKIDLPSNVKLIGPVGYVEFLRLLKNCKLVLTDSGGVQEEAIILKKPCITLRHTSARWETIILKANVLFPLDRKDSLSDIIETMIHVEIKRNPYGENVAKLTASTIYKILRNG